MSFPAYPEYTPVDLEGVQQIPVGWRVLPLKTTSTCNDEVLPESSPRDLEIQYVEISGVDAVAGVVDMAAMAFADAPSRARRRVQDGDVIVSTVRTYLRAIAPICSPPDNLIVSTGFAVVRPRRIHSGFLSYLLRSELIVGEIIAQSVGVSYPAINASDVMRIKAPVPADRQEQGTIAAFLDRETGKIDALVAEQENLIELLKEKQQAVISHAVTKGLDPDVPMKDSGIEWLGEVPARWEAVQLKHVVRAGSSITYGIVQAGPHIEDGIPYIKTSDMAGDTLPLNGYSKTSPEIDQAYARSKVEQGDLVIAIRATVGKCLPVPPELEGANLTQGTAKISPGPRVDGKFLLFAITAFSAQAYFDSMSKGATFKEITLDALRRTPLALPPITEQVAIADFVNDENARISELIDEARRGIDLLTERKSALISAAVTGKIDVRGLMDADTTEAA